MITVKFRNRAGNDVAPPKNIVFTVERYSNKAIGGPFEATITAIGTDLGLWELIEYIRYTVLIYAEQGDLVWHGYVASVEIAARNPFSETNAISRVSASVDQMFNKVAVAWEDIAVGTGGGARQTTDWANNTLSQSEYGIKEALWSGASASDLTLAEQTRDILLEQKKYPIPSIELNYSGNVQATISCRGWWDTLNWLYCPIPAELALSYTTYNNWVALGITGYEQYAQGIQPTGGDINLNSLQIYVNSVGTITDDITVSIYTNPDDLTPTTLIQAGSSIDGATVTGTFQWLTSTFSPEVTLTSGTKYFIVIGRSGAVDDVNYFNLMLDTAKGYAESFSFYNGAAWANQAYSAIFKLYDNDILLTSTQVVNMLTAYGQFFYRVFSQVNSGIVSESYRDGDGTAHFEVEELMQHGTTNKRRMLASISETRDVTIYEEDQDIETNYYKVMTDGKMYDVYGAFVRPELAKCGVYARLIDVIPPSVDTTYLGKTAVRFIEMTEYDVANKRPIYTARDELDPFVVGRPLDG